MQPLGLLLRETLGLVVPHQSSLDLDRRGIKSRSLSSFKRAAESSLSPRPQKRRKTAALSAHEELPRLHRCKSGIDLSQELVCLRGGLL